MSSYDSFKMLPELLRYTMLEQKKVVVGEEGRELLMQIATEDPSADVRELATKLLQTSAENKLEETLDGGDGRYKTPEQLNGLYQLDQLYLMNEKNKAYLEGKAKPTFMRFNWFLLFMLVFTVFITGLIFYALVTNSGNASGDPRLVALMGGVVGFVISLMMFFDYRNTQRYTAEGKLLVGQVVESDVVARRETRGSGSNRRRVTRYYLVVQGIFNHPEHGKIQRTYEKVLSSNTLSFNGMSIPITDYSKNIIPTGTAIAMMYVDDSLFAFI
jgi:hypothetical protein